jgi:TonB family protein
MVPGITFDVRASGSVPSPAHSLAASSAPVHVPPALPASPRPDWVLGLLLLWGAGAAIMMARTLAAGLALSHLGPASSWQAQAEEAARAMDIPTTPRARQSASGSMPMAFGILRPAVCLPEDAASWSEERRRMVLVHEMAHIRRGDTVWHAAARFALSIYWWNPLAWTAWRECLKEAETAADDLVLAAGARASDYAALLLDVAREFTALAAGAPAALAMARRSQLEGRLIAILDERANRRPRTRAAAAVAILAAVLVVPLAAVHGQDDAASAQVPADIDATIRKAIEQKTHDVLDQAARAAERQRQYDVAQKLLDSSLQIRQQQAGANSAEYAEGLIQLGELAMRRGDQAESYFGQAAQVFGDTLAAARPLLSLGIAQLVRKNYDQALETFQRAEVLDPGRAAMATAWMAVARSHQSDDAEQAETLYRQALSLATPDSTDAAVISRMLAGYLANQGRTAEADELKASVNKPLALPRATYEVLGPGGGVYRVGGGVSPPTLTYKVEPEYSQEARVAKYQGTVTLYVEIGPDGLGHNMQVTQGLGLGLDERAVEAVSQWKFQPGTKDGQAVTVAATIQVNFRLL